MKKLFTLIFLLAGLAGSADAATTFHAISTASTSNATSYASGAFTPAANDLLVAFVTASGTIATGTMTDSQNLGFVKVTSALKNSSADTIYLFVAKNLANAKSMTVTFDCTGDAATGAIIQVVRISGMNRTGLNAILQFAMQENQAAAGTPAPAFGAAAQTGNPTLGVVGNSTNPATMTAPTGWTENDDAGYITPTTGAEYVVRDSGFTGTTVTWGSTSASAFGAVIVELDTTTPSFSWSFVQANKTFAGTTSTTCVVSTTGNVTAGDLLFVGASAYGATPTLSIADNHSHTWSTAVATFGTSSNAGWFLIAPASETMTVTITLSATAINSCGISQYNFTGFTAALDASGTADAFFNASVAFVTTSGNLAADDELVIGWYSSSSGNAVSAGGGFTSRAADATRMMIEDIFLKGGSTEGTRSATWSLAANSTSQAFVVTFKLTAASSGCANFITLTGVGCK